MIGLNAYFLQSSALANVTKLFGLVSADEQTAETSNADAPTVSAAGGIRDLVSGQVGDALLAMKPTPKSDEDKSLPAGWSKYGNPGVRGYESLDEIEDPDVRAFFERSEEIMRPYVEAQEKYGFNSFEYRTVGMTDAERDAVFAAVKPALDQYGIDSVEYRDAFDLATKTWGVSDLESAKLNYESAKEILANPTHLREVSNINEQGQTRYASGENGRRIYELAPYSPEERAAAQKLVDDYQQTMADMLKKVEKEIRKSYGMTGQVMVQDKNGEYQWGAFRAYNTYTGASAYALSSDGIMTGYGNSGEVLKSFSLSSRWG